MRKYIDQRGTIFTLSGDSGHVIKGGWDFKVISNNIDSIGELTISHRRNEHDETPVTFTFAEVKVYDRH